jgi:hypothetical protein
MRVRETIRRTLEHDDAFVAEVGHINGSARIDRDRFGSMKRVLSSHCRIERRNGSDVRAVRRRGIRRRVRTEDDQSIVAAVDHVQAIVIFVRAIAIDVAFVHGDAGWFMQIIGCQPAIIGELPIRSIAIRRILWRVEDVAGTDSPIMNRVIRIERTRVERRSPIRWRGTTADAEAQRQSKNLCSSRGGVR